MIWDYRIVQKTIKDFGDNTKVFDIYKCQYKQGSKFPCFISEKPISLESDDPKTIERKLELMILACEKPIVIFEKVKR